MKATAHLPGGGSYAHRVQIRNHQLTVDEPEDIGGGDTGPTPQELLAASLASCTAITMEMYAQRKGWDVGPFDVSVQYAPPERGGSTRFIIDVSLPAGCTEEQRERLAVIATKCPVHRILEGEAVFEEHVSSLPI